MSTEEPRSGTYTETPEPTPEPPAPSVHGLRRNIFTVGAGNLLEWYDFGIYGYFAIVLSKQFFPGEAALLLTFATFGVGFLARPLGAVIFGHIGDRYGRQRALLLAVFGMAAVTFLMGCLPNFHSIGYAAPVILTILRLLQGFSAGGEWAGSAAYMIETAPSHRRGFAGSWQEFSLVVALVLSSGVAALVNGLLSAQQVASWGWRLPFFAGILIAVPALVLRAKAGETPAFEALKADKETATAPLKEIFVIARIPMLKAAGFAMVFTVAFYVLLTFLSTWLVTSAGFSSAFALVVVTVENAVLAILIPLTGAWSDKVGRKPLLLTACALFAVLSYPMFLVMEHASAAGVLAIAVLFAVILALFSGPAPTTLAELFPTRVRYTALSIPYQTVIAICGGFAPFIATLLIEWTHQASAPSWYLVLAAVITFLTVITFPETARKPLP
ncbi:MFS transporter [Amycolatopsis echigonensis]|uniref:Putative proline/betaine transporter n=1 Tax=Amycolatopsis echigonensis TaxID=2576905 RepID=A0A8E1W918_9PSEU|nr:MFS transporter [Amycolatopsis echigonensis]MBB2505685.1 MFS transporter [Amycolatopsis echigonensis]